MFDQIRVRLAPSPTGKLHIGTARTALFNYLFAKKSGGQFVLRIEDTDRERSQEIYTQDIIDGLRYLGLDWDEGPEKGGQYEPYFQQEREHIYNEYLNKLLESKKAYKCFCTPEEIELEREQAKLSSRPYHYSGKCRHLTNEEINARGDAAFAIRLAVESQTIVYDDLLHGQMSFEAEEIGDFIIVRSDGTPVFLFTNALDDALMKITHVLRGDDHIANTPKQILILQALGLDAPNYGHFPLIFNADRSKMSKRKDPTSITEDFRNKGFLPEALINFIALLGWSSGSDQEIFSMQELINHFSLERIGKSPSIFDPEKLLWMNGYYIRQLSIEELGKRAEKFIKNSQILSSLEKDRQYYYRALKLIQERMKRLDEIDELIGLFYTKPRYESTLLVAKKSTPENAQIALEATLETIKGLDDLSPSNIEPILRQLASKNKLKDGELLWTVRAALSGAAASPGAFELIEVLGKEESIKRLGSALKQIAK